MGNSFHNIKVLCKKYNLGPIGIIIPCVDCSFFASSGVKE
jgi:hypothetical protein